MRSLNKWNKEEVQNALLQLISIAENEALKSDFVKSTLLNTQYYEKVENQNVLELTAFLKSMVLDKLKRR